MRVSDILEQDELTGRAVRREAPIRVLGETRLALSHRQKPLGRAGRIGIASL